MYNLPKVQLHPEAAKKLPASGQRRDMLMKALRKIQVSPDSSADFHWEESRTGSEKVAVTLCVGYAISWAQKSGNILVLDIHGQ